MLSGGSHARRKDEACRKDCGGQVGQADHLVPLGPMAMNSGL